MVQLSTERFLQQLPRVRRPWMLVRFILDDKVPAVVVFSLKHTIFVHTSSPFLAFPSLQTR